MQDADLFMELAGIAGVFVGFGALIAVRSGGPSQPEELAPMRGMVSMGMLTILAALAPVTLGRYDLGEHQVWALSSAIALAGWVVMLAAMAGTPEYRANWSAELEADRTRPRWRLVAGSAFFVLLMIAVSLTPVAILLGVAPDLEAALYYALVVLILLGAGWTLLEMVFAQRSPAGEPDRADLPTAGGASA